MRRLLVLLVLAAVAALISGCDSDDDASGGARAPAGAGAGPEDPYLGGGGGYDCADFSSWREAQDVLDADPEAAADIDEYGDGVACVSDLAQPEYEDAWTEAYPEACAAIFDESSTGALYGDDGTEYVSLDCENADPGPGDWEADASSEPADDGHRDGWQSACEETFGPSVAFGDLQLNDEGISLSQIDCENESPY